MAEFKPLMPFVGENGHPLFVKGFECGQLWELLANDKPIGSRLIHSDNIDQVHLICEYYKVRYDISPIDETWSTLTIK